MFKLCTQHFQLIILHEVHLHTVISHFQSFYLYRSVQVKNVIGTTTYQIHIICLNNYYSY